MELKLVVILLLLFKTAKFTYGAPIESDSVGAEKVLLNALNETVDESVNELNATKLFNGDKIDEKSFKTGKNSDSVFEKSGNVSVKSVNKIVSEFNGTEFIRDKFDEERHWPSEEETSNNVVDSEDAIKNAVNKTVILEAPILNLTESLSVESDQRILKSSKNANDKSAIETTSGGIASNLNLTESFEKKFDKKLGKTSVKALTNLNDKIVTATKSFNKTLPSSKTSESVLNNNNNNFTEGNPLDDLLHPDTLSPTLLPPKAAIDNGVILPNTIEDNEILPEWYTKDRYQPSNLPPTDNKVFNEFMRLSKLTQYMLLDPKFAEDYQKGNLTSLTKVLFVVYGDAVKHIFSSPALTFSGPPQRKSRIRFRIKSLNDEPPMKCSEMGRETARLFCPFSYGYRWWDCLMPDEVCDGIPHCGLGDDEDPKMCLYYKAALSQFQRAQRTIEAAQSRQQQSRPTGHKVLIYNPADKK